MLAESTESRAIWSLEEDGIEQLKELDSMERNQDRSYWASTAIFVAANAILAAVFFQQEEHYLARTAIGMLGLLVTAVWLLIANRAHQFQVYWRAKAEALETELGIDERFRVWGKTPKGFSSWGAIMIAMLGFIAFWAVSIAFAAYNLLA